MGTTGPASTNPATGQPYGLDFPVVTIRDMVRAQAHAARPSRHRRRCSASPAARWAACRCCNGRRAIPSASSRRCRSPTAARHSAQNIAFHEVGRQAIMADPDWRGGRYLDEGTQPAQGPRRRAHGARTSPICRNAALHRKFGRNLQDRDAPTFAFDADFQIESYLRHQGMQLRRALRRQLLSLHHPGDGLFRSRRGPRRLLAHAFKGIGDALLRDLLHLRLAVPDRRFAAPSCMRSTPPAPRVGFVEIESDKGHDAFLLDEPEMFADGARLHRRRRRAARGHCA